MRFKLQLVIGFTFLILFQLLLLARQAYDVAWLLLVLVAAITLVMLLLVLIDRFTAVHGFLLVVLFLTMLFVLLFRSGEPTITTLFLSGLFSMTYMISILLILVHNWRGYILFDKMIESMHDNQTTIPAYDQPGEDPDYPILGVEEPPRIRITEDDDGEWVEIKAPKKAPKKIARKKRAKKR